MPLAIGEVFNSIWDCRQLISEQLIFPHAYTFRDGMLHPGDEPGPGVSLDEELAASFPYQPAMLPVARLEDGTMHDW